MYIVKIQGPPHAKWWWRIQQIWRLSSSVYACLRVPKHWTCNQRARMRLCNSTRSHAPTAHVPITAMTDTRLAPDSSMRVPQVTEPAPCITLVFLQISPLSSLLKKSSQWSQEGHDLHGLKWPFTNNSFGALVVSKTCKNTTQPR